MKLGIFSAIMREADISEMVQAFSQLGVDAVEIGSGGYSQTVHGSASELLADPARLRTFKSMINQAGLEISALSCHGNPVHPSAEIAAGFHQAFEQTVELAADLGIDQVITFSGCPGDGDGGGLPNWVAYPWPAVFSEILEYQWNDILIPYWQKACDFAGRYGIRRIALEMHPGFCVYNPETLLRLRSAAGEMICTNFDPSHLFWQGIDPAVAIRNLGSAITHVHAKDTLINPLNMAARGSLDFEPDADESQRPWSFCTVGNGHSERVWKEMFAALESVGYDGVISIEHEDSRMSVLDGLHKAVSFLRPMI